MSTASKTDTPLPQERALVWDLPLRLFHWALALCMAGSWLTAELGFEWTQVHFYLGYTSLGLVVFRLAWAVVGPRHARFPAFVFGLRAIIAQAKTLASSQPSTSVGHTAIGGWVALAMIVLVGVQASTGLFISDDIFYAGPYNPLVSTDTARELAGWHHLNFNLLLALVGLHLCAVVWYRVRKGQNLAGAMITGLKTAPAQEGIESSKLGLALVVASVVAGAVVALVLLAPPPVVDAYF